MVDRQSGTIDSFDSHPLGLDPFDLNKFSGLHNYYYRLFSDELMKFLKDCAGVSQYLNTTIRKAIKMRDTIAVHRCLELGADPRALSASEDTLLHVATFNRD